MNYQKMYMNQIFSSSLMGQVALMWRNQLLCDAVIKTGNTETKAHRLVLVAACPMLQTMENAAIGSHLEVHLASDIKQEAVESFLRYLYEGYMMLTGENYKDVEKIGKLLQVESIVRCCTDFSKCLSEKTGVPFGARFGMNESPESVYVKSSALLKVQETTKRQSSNFNNSPDSERKRQKTNQPTPPPPLLLPMLHIPSQSNERTTVTKDYTETARNSDSSFESNKSLGTFDAGFSPQTSQSHKLKHDVDVLKDSIEIVHREPPDPTNHSESSVQQTMALSVASKISNDRNVQVVNVANTLPHQRTLTSSQNIHSSPHSNRKSETFYSSDSRISASEVSSSKQYDNRTQADIHSRPPIRQNSSEFHQRRSDIYPSNLPSSEILGSDMKMTSLHDMLIVKSGSSTASTSSLTSPGTSSPYRPPIPPLSHRPQGIIPMQKAFAHPMFRPGFQFDGRSMPGGSMGTVRHLPPMSSAAVPLTSEENNRDVSNSSISVPSSPHTPSVPDLSIIKAEEPAESEDLHIDIPEESLSRTATPHNTEEEPPGDDSSNAGSEGGSLWQDNSVKAHTSHDKYQLWEFIRDLLHDPRYCPKIIQWENAREGVFRIVDSAEVARLWGKTKKFTKMTYDHMGRAFRYSKTMGYFSDIPKNAGYPKKLCFKFGPKAINWLPPWLIRLSEPINLVMKDVTKSTETTNEQSLDRMQSFTGNQQILFRRESASEDTKTFILDKMNEDCFQRPPI